MVSQLTTAKAERVLWGVGSGRAMRVHWALAELDLDYHTVAIETRTPAMETAEFLAINPRKKIPVFQDGDFRLTESPAIVTYLAERYSTDQHRLIPEAVEERGRYFEWLSFVSMELDATSLYVLRRHEDLGHIYGVAPAANEAARAYFDRMIRAAASRLDDGRCYLLGPAFSGADILMTTCLDWAKACSLRLPDAFESYRERVVARPSHAVAFEANRPQ